MMAMIKYVRTSSLECFMSEKQFMGNHNRAQFVFANHTLLQLSIYITRFYCYLAITHVGFNIEWYGSGL